MPRISAEARGATSFQPDAKPHSAPETLTPGERKIWYDIVNSKPHDWFDQGSLLLLERYCVLTVQARELTIEMRTAETGALRSWARKEMNQTCMVMSNLALRLRLAVQGAVGTHSRMLDEKGPGAKADDKLLGGQTAWGERRLRVA